MKKLFICVVIGTLMSPSCRESSLVEKFYPLDIKNSSSTIIGFYIAGKDAENVYPDTTLPDVKPPLIFVDPNDLFTVDSREPWSEYIAGMPGDTLSIYIFDRDTINQIPWAEIVTNNNILKRFDVSSDDVSNGNSTIEYVN